MQFFKLISLFVFVTFASAGCKISIQVFENYDCQGNSGWFNNLEWNHGDGLYLSEPSKYKSAQVHWGPGCDWGRVWFDTNSGKHWGYWYGDGGCHNGQSMEYLSHFGFTYGA